MSSIKNYEHLDVTVTLPYADVALVSRALLGMKRSREQMVSNAVRRPRTEHGDREIAAHRRMIADLNDIWADVQDAMGDVRRAEDAKLVAA